ncbi:MAG: acetoacetate--CoA ligase [Solirubrobacteraceae bacterium]|nr:acetoacetate--CoA ligase [Solirubrobacteraceae bacterium]
MSVPPVIWSPTSEQVERSALARFAAFVGRPGASYDELWRWSVDDLDGFWSAIWRFGGVAGDPPRALPHGDAMPGTDWFPDAAVNYAEHLLTHRDDPDAVAIVHASELRDDGAWSWGGLRRRTARIRAGLVAHGVGRGDRVAAYLPNVPDTIAAMLATASLGAIWTVAAPEFGADAVIDRFAQVEPKVLLGVDGYRYGGKDVVRTDERERIATAIGATLVPFGHLDGSGWADGFLGPDDAALSFERVPFGHPLWILYSSGTTGLPKPIVHGHGGILLEQLKLALLHTDLSPDDRMLWFTTTGWMMWNHLVGMLLSDAAIVLYDGTPAGDAVWDLCDRTGVTVFGTSAAFVDAQRKRGIDPRDGRDLRIRAVGSTGSPLAPEGFAWLRDVLDGPWIFSLSGGTDVCTAFVGGVPTLPVHLGELQAPALGARLEAWDDDGRPVVGEVGELVLTAPMPSMPVAFWGDDDGSRLREAYFDHFPGVWRHGDWIEITDRGTAIIHGRSDATINRGGIRMGTAEIYRAVLTVDAVVDALVIDVPGDDGALWMPLFVVLREGTDLDDATRDEVRGAVRRLCSPRHVPDVVIPVATIPRTLSGKVLELPVKRILMGHDPDRVVNRDAIADPAALDALLDAAREHRPTAG